MEEYLYDTLINSLVDDINGNPQKVRELVTKVLKYEATLKEVHKQLCNQVKPHLILEFMNKRKCK